MSTCSNIPRAGLALVLLKTPRYSSVVRTCICNSMSAVLLGYCPSCTFRLRCAKIVLRRLATSTAPNKALENSRLGRSEYTQTWSGSAPVLSSLSILLVIRAGVCHNVPPAGLLLSISHASAATAGTCPLPMALILSTARANPS